jgi:hypothetical protein
MERAYMAAGLALALAGPALAQTAPAPAAEPPVVNSPANAAVYMIAPRPGARVRSPVLVQFGLRNMGVTQAGSSARDAGHHHLIVDSTLPLVPGQPIPADKNHLHFGGGQTEVRVDLPPGRHTLQLVLGDALHRPFAPSVQSAKVEIVVLSPQPRPRPRRAAQTRRRW